MVQRFIEVSTRSGIFSLIVCIPVFMMTIPLRRLIPHKIEDDEVLFSSIE